MRRLVGVVLAAALATPVLVLSSLSGAAPTVAVGRSDDAQVAAAPAELRAAFLAAARRFALPPALLVAVAEVESGFDPAAVGPHVAGGPALGMMQFLPSSWARFNVVPGATPFQPGPAILAAANHLLQSGRLSGGAWDAAQALYGYNHSDTYVRNLLQIAARHGYAYSPHAPPLDPVRYVFPVAGPSSYGPGHHDYPATDVFAAIGTPVVANVRAEVLRLSRAEVGLGGVTVTLRGEDGWRYYYAHLAAVHPAIQAGQVVEPGQLLGTSGNTGNARTTPPHLHFGISRTGSAAGQMDPYPYLQAWQRGSA
ncbi:MAG TPA: peptidoglycan DD-metalloendopeptidase family protein [Acidimicrobiales bacterium]|nr:peptidoglycan DD-metalloendopeptidase family protein [Acidimicrobiales bacterium]